MEIQPSSLPVLVSEKQKEITMKIRIEPLRKIEQEKKVSFSTIGIRCNKCSKSFLSTKALFGHLRIHRKSTRGALTASVLPLRQAKLSDEFIAACILMRMRRSNLETENNVAKQSKLRWVCAKIDKQRKNMKKEDSNQSGNYQGIIHRKVAPSLLALAGQSVGQWDRNNSNEEMNAYAAGSAEVEIHECEKCHKVFKSGQALGGHKRAHYTGSPLGHPASNARLQAGVAGAAAAAVVRDFDLNEPVEEASL